MFVLLWVCLQRVTYVVIAPRAGWAGACVPPSDERVVSQHTRERALGEVRRISDM